MTPTHDSTISIGPRSAKQTKLFLNQPGDRSCSASLRLWAIGRSITNTLSEEDRRLGIREILTTVVSKVWNEITARPNISPSPTYLSEHRSEIRLHDRKIGFRLSFPCLWFVIFFLSRQLYGLFAWATSFLVYYYYYYYVLINFGYKPKLDLLEPSLFCETRIWVMMRQNILAPFSENHVEWWHGGGWARRTFSFFSSPLMNILKQ